VCVSMRVCAMCVSVRVNVCLLFFVRASVQVQRRRSLKCVGEADGWGVAEERRQTG